jgi:hypothetical protein
MPAASEPLLALDIRRQARADFARLKQILESPMAPGSQFSPDVGI